MFHISVTMQLAYIGTPLSVVPSKNFSDSLPFLYSVNLYIFIDGQMKEVVDPLKDDAPHLDSILTHMGSMYASLNKVEKSLDAYQRAIYIMERTYGKCIFQLVMLVLFTIYSYLPTVNGCGYVVLLICLIKRRAIFFTFFNCACLYLEAIFLQFSISRYLSKNDPW